MVKPTLLPRADLWNDWYAWYPVAFGPHIAWFKKIQRRHNVREQSWYYRFIPK